MLIQLQEYSNFDVSGADGNPYQSNWLNLLKETILSRLLEGVCEFGKVPAMTREKRLTIVRVFLEHEARVGSRTLERNLTLLEHCAGAQDAEMVQLFLRHGLNPLSDSIGQLSAGEIALLRRISISYESF